MNSKELNELNRYFILSDYRDGDYFLLDEYNELNDIIKRNKIANHFENLRYKYLKGIIKEEEYNNICKKYIIKLTKTIK